MGRPLRLEFEGALYHITARGNERREIFRDDDDQIAMLEIISGAIKRYNLRVYAYVLMSNHYHMLLETVEANLIKVMHDIQTAYTQKFNHRHRRIGHLFQGRYKSILVDKDAYLLELSRYIHLNPVRAGIVKLPQDYRWSSYRRYMGEKVDSWVDVDWLLGWFEEGNTKRASETYRAFVEDGMEQSKGEVFKDMWGGFVLGRVDYIKEIKGRMKEKVISVEMPREINRFVGPRLEDIAQEVTRRFGVDKEELKQKRKGNFEAAKVAIYLSRKMTAYGINQIVGYFGGRHYSMVSRLVREVDEKRAREKGFDRLLNRLEANIMKSQVKT